MCGEEEGAEIGLLHFIELFTPRQGLELALGRSAGMAIWNQESWGILTRGAKIASRASITKPEESSIINLNVLLFPQCPLCLASTSQAIIFQLMNLKIDLAQVGGVRAAPNLYNLVFVEKNNYYYCNLLL